MPPHLSLPPPAPSGSDPAEERFRRVVAAFRMAIAVEGSLRAAALERACAGDGALRAEVEAMLNYAASPAAVITQGGGMAPEVAGRIIGRTSSDHASEALIPVLKGQYRIEGSLGQGGMGVVYRAEQANPRRVVAIKAIRPGLTSRHVLRRFEREAHILGRLQHPGIAQVYEAGASSSRADEAFFVMEFVDGVPITDYAAAASLSVQQRLDLLARVCDAVQHAHQRRVIHRDLKPGNILVTADGQPKILDFGVARLDDGTDADSLTRQTQVGQLIGTLAYMAPEQLEGLEVDARADVYALGVILYRLLTGKLPHDLTGDSPLEAARLIRNDPQVRAAAIDPNLRGDIDIIVQKATERDRERRYQSAADLGADLRRHLSGEPIQARADSAVYVIRKQLMRHKGVSAAILAAALALAAFSVYASVQSSSEAAAKQRANANAERYRTELSLTNVERGRLLGMTGNFPMAEKVIWKEHAASPSDLSQWALWELYSRMPVRATLPGHPDTAIRVSASPRGDLAATTSGPDIMLWDTGTWASAGVIHFDSEVAAARFSPDGSKLISGSSSGELSVWKIEAGGQQASLTRVRLESPVFSMALPDSGPAPWPLYVLGADGTLRVLGLSSDGTLTRSGTLAATTPSVVGNCPIAISPDRALVAAGTQDGALLAWRTDTRELAWRSPAHTGRVMSLAFSPEGSLLVSGGSDRTAFFWDVAGMSITASVRHALQWDNGSVRSLDFSPDGRSILASGFWRTEVWDAQSRARADGYTVCNEASGSAVWVNGGAGILASGTESVARVWEARPGGHVRRFEAHKDGVAGLALSPRGDFLASSGNDGTIRVRRWPTMEDLWQAQAGNLRVRSLEFSVDGSRLVSAGADGVIRVWDAGSGACTVTIPGPLDEYYVAGFSPDGRRLLSAARGNSIGIFDAVSGASDERLTVSKDVAGIVAAEFLDDGRQIVLAHARGVAVWDPATPGTTKDSVTAAAGWTLCRLSPDRIAVGTWSGTIEAFDLQTLTPVQKLVGHTQLVTSLAQGPDLRNHTQSLVSASGDGLIKLWDVSSGTCLLTLSSGAGAVMRVVASPDHRWLITGHPDGTLRVWDLAYYDPHIRTAASMHPSSEGQRGVGKDQ